MIQRHVFRLTRTAQLLRPPRTTASTATLSHSSHFAFTHRRYGSVIRAVSTRPGVNIFMRNHQGDESKNWAHPINPVDASVPGQLYMGCCRNLFLTPITPILGMQHLCCLCEIQAHPTSPVEMYATTLLPKLHTSTDFIRCTKNWRGPEVRTSPILLHPVPILS